MPMIDLSLGIRARLVWCLEIRVTSMLVAREQCAQPRNEHCVQFGRNVEDNGNSKFIDTSGLTSRTVGTICMCFFTKNY
jgi:hypothetical protein